MQENIIKNSDRLIVTRGDKGVKEQLDISLPIIKRYAERIGADFMLLDEDLSEIDQLKDNLGKYHYRLFKLHELFKQYDRIAHIDADVIIAPLASDIFWHVDRKFIGTVFEDTGSRLNDRRQRISDVQKKWGLIGWKSGYINTGVCVFSKEHRNIFATHKDEYWVGNGFDDVHLGYNINKYKYDVMPLDPKWNLMSMFLEGIENKMEIVQQSYFIHMAGLGYTWLCQDRIIQMKMIKEHWYG